MSQTHPIEGFLSGLVKQVTARPDTVASELDHLRAIRRQTISLIFPVTEAQGAFVPRPGAWSIAQILDHTVLLEGLYRDSIRNLFDLARKGKKPEIRYTMNDIDVSMPSVPQAALSALAVPLDFANRFIPAVVRQTVIRFPLVAASAPTVAQPRTNLTMTLLRNRLLESANRNGELLSAPLPGDPEKMTISHPILGINNVLDIMGIMAAHEERHQGQIRDILADRRLPKG